MTRVSVRIPDDLKAEADEYGINKSDVMRSALAAEVRRRRREQMADRGEEIADAFDAAGVTREDITAAVRTSRDEDAS